MGKRGELAKELFYSGYNCAQSVIGAFEDKLSVPLEVAMQMCDGLGGGMGRMRLTCGAVSAMAVMAGVEKSAGKPAQLDNRAEVYAAVREMAEKFKEKHSTVICSELLGSSLPKDNGAHPEERTAEYYKKRPCPEIAAECADIISEVLFGGE